MNDNRVLQLNEPTPGNLSRHDTLSPNTMASNMPNEVDWKQGGMKKDGLDAMWTPTSLVFESQDMQLERGATPSFGQNMRLNNMSVGMMNDYPLMAGYAQTAQSYANALTLPPMALDTQAFTCGQDSTAFIRWQGSNAFGSMRKPVPDTMGIYQTGVYQQYPAQQPVRTPLTASSTPALPFADGERGIDSLGCTEYLPNGTEDLSPMKGGL